MKTHLMTAAVASVFLFLGTMDAQAQNLRSNLSRPAPKPMPVRKAPVTIQNNAQQFLPNTFNNTFTPTYYPPYYQGNTLPYGIYPNAGYPGVYPNVYSGMYANPYQGYYPGMYPNMGFNPYFRGF